MVRSEEDIAAEIERLRAHRARIQARIEALDTILFQARSVRHYRSLPWGDAAVRPDSAAWARDRGYEMWPAWRDQVLDVVPESLREAVLAGFRDRDQSDRNMRVLVGDGE